MNIFTLMGTVLIDNDKANQSISKTGNEADNMSTKIGNGMKKVAQVGAIIATATIAGATALGGLAIKSAATADRIDKMSQRLGMSREAFQEWDFVLSQNGVSIDSMQTAMKALTGHMAGVKGGVEKNIDVYKRLDSGIIRLIKSGASQEEVFKATIISFQKMPEGIEKARLAQELFGKQGQEMLPMLNASKGSIEELMQKARDLGLVMSSESVDAGVKLTDTIDQMKRSFGAMATQIGVKVMPVIQGFLDKVIDNMPQIQRVAGGVFDAISTALGFVIDSLDVLIPLLSAIVAGFVAFKVVSAVSALIAFFQTAIAGASTATALFNAILAANPIGLIAIAIAVVIGLIIALAMNWDKVIYALDKAWGVIRDFSNNIWRAIKEAFASMWKVIKDFWSNTVDWFKSIPKQMGEFGQKIITGLWDGIKKMFKKVADWVTEKVEWMKDKLMFWKKGEAEMSKDNVTQSTTATKYQINGSHAKGLDYVPFDGYIAELHKGEEVVTEKEAAERRSNSSGTNETNNLLRNLIGEFSAMKQAYKEQPREMLRISREGAV